MVVRLQWGCEAALLQEIEMARRGTISYGTRTGLDARTTGEYYLATTTDRMQFYCFDEPKEGVTHSWTLIDELDRSRLLAAGDKATAKTWANRLGLKNFTYVRV